MAPILQEFRAINAGSIKHEIENHPGWLGRVSGLKAEKLLRGLKRPYLYVLRAGEGEEEHQKDYYVSFILPDFSIKHQPFLITISAEGWCFEQGASGGPYKDTSIDDVLHLIMRCHKDECAPLIQFEKCL